jgi:hypothetical protein
MPHTLDYASAPIERKRRRWLLPTTAILASLGATALILGNSIAAIKFFSDNAQGRYTERSEALARLLILCPEALLVSAIAWWIARRTGHFRFFCRTSLFINVALWLAVLILVH